MKVATVKLGWKKSVSTDISKVKLSITNGGVTSMTELPPETEEFTIKVNASTPFAFTLTAIDSDDVEATSITYSHTLGDLEAPQPPTDLFHQIVSVDDVPDSPPPTPAPPPL